MQVPLEIEPLSYGFTMVEYLESTGSQYVNTEIIPDVLTKWQFKALSIGWVHTSGSYESYGTRVTSPSRRWFSAQMNSYTAPNDFIYGFGGTNYNSGKSTSIRTYTIDGKRKVCYDDLGVISVSGNISNIKAPITLFAMSKSDEISDFAIVNFTASRCYFSKIWKDVVLIQHLIPCLDPHNRPCMFDLVSRKPFYNAGTGEFLYA